MSPKLASMLQRPPDHLPLRRKSISRLFGEVRMGPGSVLKLLQIGVWPFPVLCASGTPLRQSDENAKEPIPIFTEELFFGFGSKIAIYSLPEDISYLEKVEEN